MNLPSTTTRLRTALSRATVAALAAPPIYAILLAVLIAIVVVNPRALSTTYFLAFLVKPAAALMILAVGEAFVIISGEFDISVGSLVTVVVVASGGLLNGDPSLTPFVLVAMLGIGVAVGLVNAFVVTRFRVPSFIATLGMLLLLNGGVFYITNGSPTGSLPDNFRFLGRSNTPSLPLIGPIPFAVIVLIVVGLAAAYLLHRTDFGAQVYAVGSNVRAAALAGVGVGRVKAAAFVISSVLAVIAGVLLGGFAGISPQVGVGLEFQAVSAVVLGGAALGGGRGSVGAALAGGLTLQAIFSLLNLLGMPAALRFFIQGLILIGAVSFSEFRVSRPRPPRGADAY